MHNRYHYDTNFNIFLCLTNRQKKCQSHRTVFECFMRLVGGRV